MTRKVLLMDDVRRQVIALIAKIAKRLDINKIDTETKLSDIGLKSLGLAKLCVELENKYAIDIVNTALGRMPGTIGDICNMVTEVQSNNTSRENELSNVVEYDSDFINYNNEFQLSLAMAYIVNPCDAKKYNATCLVKIGSEQESIIVERLNRELIKQSIFEYTFNELGIVRKRSIKDHSEYITNREIKRCTCDDGDLEEYIRRECVASFSPGDDLFNLCLVTSNGELYLFLDFCHLAMDGVSLRVFVSNLLEQKENSCKRLAVKKLKFEDSCISGSLKWFDDFSEDEFELFSDCENIGAGDAGNIFVSLPEELFKYRICKKIDDSVSDYALVFSYICGCLQEINHKDRIVVGSAFNYSHYYENGSVSNDVIPVCFRLKHKDRLKRNSIDIQKQIESNYRRPISSIYKVSEYFKTKKTYQVMINSMENANSKISYIKNKSARLPMTIDIDMDGKCINVEYDKRCVSKHDVDKLVDMIENRAKEIQ